jgi:long-chain acyl-CoA synthetase
MMDTLIENPVKPWSASYGSDVRAELTYESVSLPGYLQRTAMEHPNRIALIEKGVGITYSELVGQVDILVYSLKKFGVKKGACAGILMHGRIAYVVSFFAILKSGATVVPIDPRLSDKELERQFTMTGIKVLVTSDDQAERMVRLRNRTRLERVIYTTDNDYQDRKKGFFARLMTRWNPMEDGVEPARDLYPWRDIMAEKPLVLGMDNIPMADPAVYRFTAGTTEPARCVVLSHGNLSRQSQQIDAWFPFLGDGAETILGAVPPDQPASMVFTLNWAVMKGWGLILMDSEDPVTVLKALRRLKPVVAIVDGGLIRNMLRNPSIRQNDLASLKACISMNAPLTEGGMAEFEKRTSAVLVEGYGLSEATWVTHLNPASRKRRRAGFVGIPVPDTDCRIVDLKNPSVDMPAGIPGELLVKGPQIMAGYLGETRRSPDTWLRTGDVAVMDDTGFFRILDRVSDAEICDGHSVYPSDIDRVIRQHNKVKEACAVGIERGDADGRITLFVVLKPGETATSDEFIQFCRDKLNGSGIPALVEFRDELPKTAGGTIRKQMLRDDDGGGARRQ